MRNFKTVGCSPSWQANRLGTIKEITNGKAVNKYTIQTIRFGKRPYQYHSHSGKIFNLIVSQTNIRMKNIFIGGEL